MVTDNALTDVQPNWSPYAYLYAAAPPDAPPSPRLVAGSRTPHSGDPVRRRSIAGRKCDQSGHLPFYMYRARSEVTVYMTSFPVYSAFCQRSSTRVPGVGTRTGCTIEWDAPTSTGGIPLTGFILSRNPRHFDIIEGGRVYQALHIDSKSVLDALCRVKKCLRPSI